MNDYIELQIIEAVQGVLIGTVNEILRDTEFSIPVIEFGNSQSRLTVVPEITLSACEQTEKERIIRLEAYSLNISFSLPDMPESELHCYACSGAVGRAFYDDPTLGRVVDRAVITGKKYIPPKKPYCGDLWELVVSLRVTVEGGKE